MHVSEYIELISKRNQNTYKYALGYVLAELNPEKNWSIVNSLDTICNEKIC